MERFRKLDIKDSIIKSIEEHGFEKPSEIQERTIPLVLKGKDVIARDATGSGKTLAFGSAIIQHSRKDGGIRRTKEAESPKRRSVQENRCFGTWTSPFPLGPAGHPLSFTRAPPSAARLL